MKPGALSRGGLRLSFAPGLIAEKLDRVREAMAAFAGWRERPGQQAGPTWPNPAGLAGTSMLKHKQQHGKAALRPSNELARKKRAQPAAARAVAGLARGWAVLAAELPVTPRCGVKRNVTRNA
jgi:hypothetical protein